MKQLKLLLLAFMLSPLFVFAQKAYEETSYKGKVHNMVLHFTLADGYPGACEIKATDVKTRKKSSFLPENGYADEKKDLTFYRRNSASKNDYFIINGMEELFETPPSKIKGVYYLKGKAYPFILIR